MGTVYFADMLADVWQIKAWHIPSSLSERQNFNQILDVDDYVCFSFINVPSHIIIDKIECTILTEV
jgi:hypothetical protein